MKKPKKFKKRYLLATGWPYTHPDGELWMMNEKNEIMEYPRILEFETGIPPKYRLILERVI